MHHKGFIGVFKTGLGEKLVILSAYFGKHETVGNPGVSLPANFSEIVPLGGRLGPEALYREPPLFS
jgi:hypothetical protein